MREHDSDYFENSRRATYIQREYACRNPRGCAGYTKDCWGISASDGPGPDVRTIDGHERRFYNYRARGVPFGPRRWHVITVVRCGVPAVCARSCVAGHQNFRSARTHRSQRLRHRRNLQRHLSRTSRQSVGLDFVRASGLEPRPAGPNARKLSHRSFVESLARVSYRAKRSAPRQFSRRLVGQPKISAASTCGAYF